MDTAKKLDLFKNLLLARVFEEKKIELKKEISERDMGPASCLGQEAIPVGFCHDLKKEDYLLPSFRSSWPAFIVKGISLKRIAAEIYGKAEGCSKGREISSHFHDLEFGVIGGTGVLAGTVTVSAGIGLALKYQKRKQVVLCFIGDGGSNREEFFTGVNLAGLRKLPVIYVVENNLIAEHTPYEKYMPIENIADRAAGFGIPGIIVDGNDLLAVYEAARETIQRAREGQGPSLVECKTCRIRPMMEMEEPGLGLPEETIAAWKKKDPVQRMKAHLFEIGALTEEEFQAMKGNFQGEVNEAFRFAGECGYAPPEEVFRDVYAQERVVFE